MTVRNSANVDDIAKDVDLVFCAVDMKKEDVRALEEVRESIQRVLAQAGVNHELGGSELGAKLDEIRQRNAEAKAQATLRAANAIKRNQVAEEIRQTKEGFGG